jgi:uncharacterized protein YicC (UPF0701 family)
MSTEHKEALALGRVQGRAVRRYLEALETSRPKRGRRRTREAVQKRLAAVDDRLEDADALSRLHLLQERQDLEEELAAMNGGGVDLKALEEEFVKAARSYSQRKGVSYAAWREVGVPASVLRRAGISRAS